MKITHLEYQNTKLSEAVLNFVQEVKQRPADFIITVLVVAGKYSPIVQVRDKATGLVGSVFYQINYEFNPDSYEPDNVYEGFGEGDLDFLNVAEAELIHTQLLKQLEIEKDKALDANRHKFEWMYHKGHQYRL